MAKWKDVRRWEKRGRGWKEQANRLEVKLSWKKNWKGKESEETSWQPEREGKEVGAPDAHSAERRHSFCWGKHHVIASSSSRSAKFLSPLHATSSDRILSGQPRPNARLAYVSFHHRSAVHLLCRRRTLTSAARRQTRLPPSNDQDPPSSLLRTQTRNVP